MNVVAFVALMTATTILAMRYGGEPERWTAILYVWGAVATLLSYRSTTIRFISTEPYVAAVDILVAAGIVAILLRADRFWPFAAFAFQGVAVLTHFIRIIDPGIMRSAYEISLALPGWCAVLVLLVGVLRHASRTRRLGLQRDWSW